MPIGWARGRKTSEMRPICCRAHFALYKRKNTLDPQAFSRIVKAMKKVQWIRNTIMNISVLEYSDNVYIFDGAKIYLDWHRLANNWLHALEQVTGVIRALQASMMVLLTKIVSNVRGTLTQIWKSPYMFVFM